MTSSPLSAVRAEDLSPALEEEIGHWEARLFWDFRPTAALIKRFVNGKCLSGSVLKQSNGEVIGYEYHVADPPVGYIGDLYVKDAYAGEETYSAILDCALRGLLQESGIRRIECQPFPLNFDAGAVFSSHGFLSRDRHFLTLQTKTSEVHPFETENNRFRLVPWDRGLFSAAAEVMYDGYRFSPDQEICHDYGTLKGCRRFLENLIDGPGCGVFQEEASILAVNPEGEVCGLLLASLIHRKSAMIPQISVKRRHQRQGLGTRMLHTFLCKAPARKWERVSLSVSERNDGAYRLYHRIGFRSHLRFRAFFKNLCDEE